MIIQTTKIKENRLKKMFTLLFSNLISEQLTNEHSSSFLFSLPSVWIPWLLVSSCCIPRNKACSEPYVSERRKNNFKNPLFSIETLTNPVHENIKFKNNNTNLQNIQINISLQIYKYHYLYFITESYVAGFKHF